MSTSTDLERRKYIRYDFPSVVEFSLDPETPGEPLKGVTINISNTGMCLYVFSPVREDQVIKFESSILPISHKKATIRWTNKFTDGFYMAGVAFS